MEWMAWIYGRFLTGYSATGVVVCTTILGAVVGAVISYGMMARSIEIHAEKIAGERRVDAPPAPAPTSLTAGGSTTPQPANPPGPQVTREPARPVKNRASTDRPPATAPAPVTVNAPGGVVSVNQQGGITANTVIVGSQVTYRLEPLRTNVPDGNRFRTEFRIQLNTQATIGELRIGVYGAHVISADVHPYDAQGPMQIQFGQGLGVQDGLYVVTIQNAYRGYTIVVFTSQPEELRLKVASA
jgi:hypothetical protein